MTARIFYILFIIISLLPITNSAIALLLGITFGLIFNNYWSSFSKNYSKKILNISIIGLGFGLNLHEAISVSKDGFLITLITISTVFVLGFILYKILKTDKNTSLLISSGTAICGGSAIAAISSVINPKANQISIALVIVFILNAVALILFPILGNLLNLSQYQFGLWSAIAIHDTSSVVGAAKTFGDEALEIATTVKLSRTLWIFPVAIIISLFQKKTNQSKIKFPFFIIGFIVAMVIATYYPQGENVYSIITTISKQLLCVSLFMIGSLINFKSFKEAGIKTMAFAIILWIAISIISLILIY
ncbi:YeiH family protein [Faecalibacter macacae]|uniref:Sulfate exporter family transporter n=1 Tax=Faecalibacter macacae TaxID=1859289 RepID=A0A3L9MCK9_9FLAO|nr:putative sulfate exporter family transporter [Faecalibacter macacae]RLZ09696.1 putative sulfate exporter family transporter [Faecalibacter macacae]